jgi:epoxyqueuosine reductase QueG
MTARLDRHVVGHLLAGAGVNAWGVARNHPALPLAPGLPTAISMMMRLDVDVVREIAEGPTPAYLEEYRRLNRALDLATGALAKAITENGSLAERVRSTQSVPDDEPVFPHKTAATQAGLGWIGKTGLFVSRQFGSAVRLATVFTDLPLTAAQPFLVGHCGTCDACVRACPAGAGRDVTWTAGMPREQIIDVVACRRQMECAGEATLHDICGICIAACPRCLLADPVA